MDALNWIGEAIQWVGRFIPRIRHLECTDIGVCIKRGTRIYVLSPGIHCFWPLWTAFYCRPANIQTANLPTQALITLDQKIVVVGGMIRYQFNRSSEAVKLALVETEDVECALIDEALAIFCAFITERSFEELRQERTKVNRSLTGKLATQLATYGVNVMRAQLTDFSPCLTLNHIGIFRQVQQVEAGE